MLFLSPILFSLFLEFVMADLKSFCKELKPDTNLDVRYADDTTISSTVFEKLQLTTEELQAVYRKWGVNINFKVTTSFVKRITLEGEELETVG